MEVVHIAFIIVYYLLRVSVGGWGEIHPIGRLQRTGHRARQVAGCQRNSEPHNLFGIVWPSGIPGRYQDSYPHQAGYVAAPGW